MMDAMSFLVVLRRIILTPATNPWHSAVPPLALSPEANFVAFSLPSESIAVKRSTSRDPEE